MPSPSPTPLSQQNGGEKRKKKVGTIQILVPLTKWQEAIAVEHLKIPRQYFTWVFTECTVTGVSGNQIPEWSKWLATGREAALGFRVSSTQLTSLVPLSWNGTALAQQIPASGRSRVLLWSVSWNASQLGKKCKGPLTKSIRFPEGGWWFFFAGHPWRKGKRLHGLTAKHTLEKTADWGRLCPCSNWWWENLRGFSTF